MGLYNYGDDDEEEDGLPQALPPTDGSGAPPPPAGAGMPSLKDILLKKYADAATEGDKNIADAQNRSLGAQAFSGLAEAAEGFARASGTARGGQGVNHAGYQQRNAMSQGMVDNARRLKSSSQDNVLKQHVMGKQLDDEAYTASTRDPNSAVSKNFRASLKSLYPDISLPDDVSYAEAKDKYPVMLAAHEAQETRRNIAQQKTDEANYRTKTLAETKREFNADRDDREKSKADAKETERAQRQLTEFKNDIGGARGSNVRTEKNKLYASEHAKQIIDAHPDLNGLTQIEVDELGMAMASQLSGGGHAAQGVIHNMTPQTFKGDLSKLLSYGTGGPQPANQGDYVKMFKGMLERQAQTSRDILASEYGPDIERHKNLLNHKDAAIKDQAMRMLQSSGLTLDKDGQLTAYQPNLSRSRTAVVEKGGDGKALAAPGDERAKSVIPQAHPDAARALDYAKNHPEDPDSQEILRRFGQPMPIPGPAPTPSPGR